MTMLVLDRFFVKKIGHIAFNVFLIVRMGNHLNFFSLRLLGFWIFGLVRHVLTPLPFILP